MPKKVNPEGLTWPAWFNNPDNTKSAVFEAPGDVPKGWTSGAERLTADSAPAPEAPVEPAVQPEQISTVELDAEGHEWSEELHVASKKKTARGLWRMKPGVARPAPKTHDL